MEIKQLTYYVQEYVCMHDSFFKSWVKKLIHSYYCRAVWRPFRCCRWWRHSWSDWILHPSNRCPRSGCQSQWRSGCHGYVGEPLHSCSYLDPFCRCFCFWCQSSAGRNQGMILVGRKMAFIKIIKMLNIFGHNGGMIINVRGFVLYFGRLFKRNVFIHTKLSNLTK